MRIYIMTPKPKEQSKDLYKLYRKLGTECEYNKKDTEIKLYKAKIIFTDYNICEDHKTFNRVLWQGKHISELVSEISKMYYLSRDQLTNDLTI